MRIINRIVIHCSASSITGQTAAMIRAWHVQRGWKDIGYHAFIRFDGSVEWGRDWDVIGAHCQGANSDSIGICLAGLTLRDFQNCQFDALKRLLTLLKRAYPTATIHGHSELDQHGKTCPVFKMDQLTAFWDAAK